MKGKKGEWKAAAFLPRISPIHNPQVKTLSQPHLSGKRRWEIQSPAGQSSAQIKLTYGEVEEVWRFINKEKEKGGCRGLVCNIVVYSIDILVTQMPKMHFSYIFNLHPWFLAHNSQNPSNVLSYKSNGNIFGNTWSLVFFLKLPLSHKGEMGSCYS